MRTQILEYQDGFFTVYGEIDIYSRPAMKFEPVLIIEYPCEIDPEVSRYFCNQPIFSCISI